MYIIHKILLIFNNLLCIFTVFFSQITAHATTYCGHCHHKGIHIAYQHGRRQQEREIICPQEAYRQQHDILSAIHRHSHIHAQHPPVKSRRKDNPQYRNPLILIIRYNLLQQTAKPRQIAVRNNLASRRHGTVIRGQIAKAALRSNAVNLCMGNIFQIPDNYPERHPHKHPGDAFPASPRFLSGLPDHHE